MCTNRILNELCLELLCCDMGCGLSTFNKVLFDLRFAKITHPIAVDTMIRLVTSTQVTIVRAYGL